MTSQLLVIKVYCLFSSDFFFKLVCVILLSCDHVCGPMNNTYFVGAQCIFRVHNFIVAVRYINYWSLKVHLISVNIGWNLGKPLKTKQILEKIPTLFDTL